MPTFLRSLRKIDDDVILTSGSLMRRRRRTVAVGVSRTYVQTELYARHMCNLAHNERVSLADYSHRLIALLGVVGRVAARAPAGHVISATETQRQDE